MGCLKVIVLVFVSHVIAFSQDSYKGFPKGFATYYAAQEFDKIAPEPGHNWRGDPTSWLNNASAKGWDTSKNVKSAEANALAVWSDGAIGHVAVIENVTSNGTSFSEMNWGKSINSDGATENFGKIVRGQMSFSDPNRGTYRFVGYIFPRLNPKRDLITTKIVPKYEVNVYNIDDNAWVYVNGVQVSSVRYQGTDRINISNWLRPGENKIRFVLENTQEEFTYGFEVLRNGESIFRDECGANIRPNSVGCRRSRERGFVYDHTFSITL